MQLRTTYPGFVDAVNLYFDKLVSVIKPLMVSQTQSCVMIFPETHIYFPCLLSQFEEGGPIIAVQAENEYGSYAKDEDYMPFIKNVSSLMYCNISFLLSFTLRYYAKHIFVFSYSVSSPEGSRSSC